MVGVQGVSILKILILLVALAEKVRPARHWEWMDMWRVIHAEEGTPKEVETGTWSRHGKIEARVRLLEMNIKSGPEDAGRVQQQARIVNERVQVFKLAPHER